MKVSRDDKVIHSMTQSPQNDGEYEILKKTIEEQKSLIHSLQSIIEYLPGSIYWKNKDGVYLGNNHFAMEKMKSVGLSCDSIIGKTDYDLFPKEVADQYRKHDLEVIIQGCVSSKEEIITLSNGETLTQLSVKHPLRDEQNNIIGIIGNTVDITHLKKIESELREAKAKAEKANQSKTEMIRHMEHDIRTPFSGIWVLANMLESQEKNKQKKRVLSDISKSAKELLDYCNKILDFIKTETSIIPISEKTFNIKELLNSIILIETVAAKSKNLKLELEISKKIPSIVIGDPNRIQQILLNLISNAIKFTEVGYVKVYAEITKKIDHQNIILYLTVEDSGIGLSPEKQSYVYKHSIDIDYPELIGCKRNGLGLPLVKKLVNELQGEIEVESKVGKGSKFICKLPLELPLVS